MVQNFDRSDSTSVPGPSAEAIQQWLIGQLAEQLRIDPSRIRVDRPILSYGVDSMQIVTIVARLEDWLGRRFASNPWEDHPTIESLSRFAAERDERSTNRQFTRPEGWNQEGHEGHEE
jgi:acyl carrier protein